MKQMLLLKCVMPIWCKFSHQKELVHVRNTVSGLVDIHTNVQCLFALYNILLTKFMKSMVIDQHFEGSIRLIPFSTRSDIMWGRSRGTHLPGHPGQPVCGCQLPCSEQHKKKEPQPFSLPIDKVSRFDEFYDTQRRGPKH